MNTETTTTSTAATVLAGTGLESSLAAPAAKKSAQKKTPAGNKFKAAPKGAAKEAARTRAVLQKTGGEITATSNALLANIVKRKPKAVAKKPAVRLPPISAKQKAKAKRMATQIKADDVLARTKTPTKKPTEPRAKKALLAFNEAALNDTTVITRKEAKCPRKAGTAAASNWKRYTPRMTYAEFCAAGGTVRQLRFDVRRGYVALSTKK